MNTKNNKRRMATRKNIENVFMELLQSKELSEISVTDICKRCGINRSTFYANYIDIYNLADNIRDGLFDAVNDLYEEDAYNNVGIDYLKLFRHIKDNQLFYKTYFKLGYDNKHMVDLSLLGEKSMLFPKEQLGYHIEFHKAGLNAVIKKWLAGGCVESPEEMVGIIESEYKSRKW